MLLERQFHARHQTEQLLLAPLETEPSAAQEPAPPTVKPRKRDQIVLRELRIVLRTIVNRLLAERRFANVFTKLPVRHEDSVYMCVFLLVLIVSAGMRAWRTDGRGSTGPVCQCR